MYRRTDIASRRLRSKTDSLSLRIHTVFQVLKSPHGVWWSAYSIARKIRIAIPRPSFQCSFIDCYPSQREQSAGSRLTVMNRAETIHQEGTDLILAAGEWRQTILPFFSLKNWMSLVFRPARSICRTSYYQNLVWIPRHFPEILRPKGNFLRYCRFWPRRISENIKIYPHNLSKKGILWSYYVNVFFKTNHLSAIFVHCLSRDGSFSNLKKRNFATFPLISTLTLSLLNSQFFHPFRGLLRPTKTRSSSLTFSPLASLSGGWL